MGHDVLIQIIFYFFAAIAVLAALVVISQNNPVRSVLALVLTFFAFAALWMLLEAEFLALILVLVYVGAVMTLFLFVVMMLNIDVETRQGRLWRYLPFSLLFLALFVGLAMLALPSSSLHVPHAVTQSLSKLVQAPQQPTVSNTEALGLVLYTDYFLAFEVAAAILLTAIIAAITLVQRGALNSKQQNIVRQIMTRSKDRVHLVSMPSEK
jgi:NADH-quinone oxidoreductase subunit J